MRSGIKSSCLRLAQWHALLFIALTFVCVAPHSASAAGTGVRGWGWNGSYYATAKEACYAQWKWAGMDNGRSRFIGALDRTDTPFYKRCEWTRYQYLCGQEGGSGSCGTVIPVSVHYSCAYGYVRKFPYACVKEADYRPERPVCRIANGGRLNPVVGNPIILSTGTKYHSVTDFASSDGKLVIARTYRSNPLGRNKSARNLPLGLARGWQFNFAMELQLGTFSGSPSSPNANVTLIAPDGSAYDFKLNSDGEWVGDTASGPASPDYSITHVGSLPADLSQIKSSSSDWAVAGSDDRLWTLKTFAHVNTPNRYDVARPLTAEEKGGYTWTYEYDPDDHRLLTITDSYSRTVSFDWSYFYTTTLSGISGALPYPEAISEIELPDGTKVAYDFDPPPATSAPSTSAIERLVGVEWRDSSDAVVNSETYHYENADYPFALTGITDHRNIRVATYTYDGRGRATATAGASGSDAYIVTYGSSGSLDTRTVTNPLGKEAIYNFAHSGSTAFFTRFAGVDGQASANCAASDTDFTYDSRNFIATVSDEEGRVTSYVRDGLGRPLQITEATGTADQRVTTVTWHGVFNVPVSVERPGLTTTYDYDSTGRLISKTETDTTTHTAPYATSGQSRTWTYTYAANDQVATIDGPLSGSGDTVSYTYGTDGYAATFTNEVGHVYTILSRNGRGQPTEVEGPNGVTRELAYDAIGRLVSDVLDPGGLGATTSYDYDAAGNISKITRPNGAFLSLSYDGNDRLTEIANNSGETISYDYDAMGNVTLSETRNANSDLYFTQSKSYDELGRLLTILRAGSAQWSFGYDKVDNLISTTDPNDNVAARTYDNLDRLAAFEDERDSTTTWNYGTTENPISTTDPHAVTTTYVRNGWGEAIQETSNDIGTVVYTRDENGEIVSRTDARNVTTNLTRDGSGRVLAVDYPGETGSNVTYTYDTGTNGIGQLTAVTDAAGTLTREYDALGRVVQETRVIGARTYVTAFRWDDAGKLTEITYPSGHIVNFGRDANGNIANVDFKESSAGPVVGLAWWVSHTPFGPRRGLLHGNELVDWRTYDGDRQLARQTLTDETVTPANVLLDRSYAYQHNRNLTAITDNLDSGQSEIYWYTPNGFLQNADGPWGSLIFYVDGAGNRTHRISTVNGVTTTIAFGIPFDSNRLDGVITDGTPTRTITSDAAGNIVSDADLTAGVTRSYDYNAPGQLASVSTGGSLAGQYSYDYLSRLTVRTLPASGTTLHYIHDLDGNIIAEYDASGTVLREYVWLDERPLAVVADAGSAAPSIWHVHTDHLQRPVMMTDDTRAVVWQATWLPFGGAHSITGSASLDRRFPGQWFQLESGLFDNWHRHYDPTTGRYLQPDPIGMPDGPNRWAYAMNSPLQFTDPNGLFAPIAIVGVCSAGGCEIGAAALLAAFWYGINSHPLPVEITPPRPQDMTPLEERQYDKYCAGTDDPCQALKAAVNQAIGQARIKMNAMLRDEGGLFLKAGKPGWITHAADMAGRLNAIRAMISLGQKMGCDMSEEAKMAADLVIPARPARPQ
ncbi:RHS repeat-associated core domain-containing protein [Notoacmeibacter ruber]|uniref:RHS repeat protein n=1 Tax=Notoacmeibacter ruber TaxID=2670375 RepID=A0A3L7J746_9HYPH|nr:RHS repeat-associated core domain-containing protein [Notoacmeibacter ruber]RLQ85271.1 RHS repeat protein [Notoacmeibacter ruber]